MSERSGKEVVLALLTSPVPLGMDSWSEDLLQVPLRRHPGDSLARDLREEWRALSFADARIVCSDGISLRCHSVVLAGLSRMLRQAVRVCGACRETDVVILAPDADYRSLADFLAGVYNGGGDRLMESVDRETLVLFGFLPDSSDDDDEQEEEKDDDYTVVDVASIKREAEEFDDGNNSFYEEYWNQDCDDDAEEPQDDTETDPDFKGPPSEGVKGRTKRSVVWRHFRRLDSEHAECLECGKVIQIAQCSTTSLIKHLEHHHSDALERSKAERELELTSVNMDDDGYVTRANKSIIWQYVQRITPEQGKCTKCGQVLSMKGGTTSSCRAHLRKCLRDNLPIELIKKKTSKDHAECFKKLDDEGTMLQCLSCKEKVEAGPNQYDAIQSHLEMRHPESVTRPFEDVSKSSMSDESQAMVAKRPFSAHEEGTGEFFPPTLNEVSGPVRDKLDIPIEEVVDEEECLRTGRKRRIRKKWSMIWNYFQSTDSVSVSACKLCGKTFHCQQQSTSNMRVHLKNRHEEQYKELLLQTGKPLPPPKEDPPPDWPKERRGGRAPIFGGDPDRRTCVVCKKVFSCRPAMLYHKKIAHPGARPFKCEECGMTFARASSFASHTHEEVRSFLCSVCGKTFARKHVRDIHERSHSGERRYKCSFCDKRFLTNQQKGNHERTHTGERPHQCTDCGRQFAQRHQLTTHIRIHTGEKPYFCKFCPQRFRHLSTRNNHKCEGRAQAERISQQQQQSAV